MRTTVYIILFGFFWFGCNSSGNTESGALNETIIDSIANGIESLITQNTKNENNKPDSIKEAPDVETNAVQSNNLVEIHYMENDIELWKNLPNPMQVKYRGTELGDYFHIYFEDTNNVMYDFGFGKNNYGEYKLFGDETGPMLDNKKYLNKSFKLFWEWKTTKYPCCSGEYNIIEGLQPTITKLELIESNINKN